MVEHVACSERRIRIGENSPRLEKRGEKRKAQNFQEHNKWSDDQIADGSYVLYVKDNRTTDIRW